PRDLQVVPACGWRERRRNPPACRTVASPLEPIRFRGGNPPKSSRQERYHPRRTPRGSPQPRAPPVQKLPPNNPHGYPEHSERAFVPVRSIGSSRKRRGI